MRFSDRITRIEPSATIAISNKASALEEDGIDVVDLSAGEPDFTTPENVVAAAEEAIEAGHTGYTPSNGIPQLREAIAAELASDGLNYNANQVVVTPGAKQALFEVIMALIDDGDDVILFDPAWVSYEAMVKVAGGSLTRIDLAPHEFQLEPALDDFAAAITDETKLVIVNSPNNPTGAVYSETALEGVRDLAVDHDLTVLSDEIYRKIMYGVTSPSLGTLSGMGDRTITVNGFSKAYAMTGWRLGYYAADDDLVAQAGKLHSHSVTCAANFTQRAGIEALTNTEEAVAEMVRTFEERRDMVTSRLADHGMDVPSPDGAFYMMLPVDDDDQAWCEGAIEDAHVAPVPGSAFGAPGYARISYATSSERLEEGIERLADAGYL